jgi:hypothetical protein
MEESTFTAIHREPWNEGKLVGQKAPLELKDIWAIRVRLQLANRARDLALFNLAIDSKLRAVDLVNLRVRDVSHGHRIAARAIVMQQKTQSEKSRRRSIWLPCAAELEEHTQVIVAVAVVKSSVRSAPWARLSFLLRSIT